jgi:hypothetical protein
MALTSALISLGVGAVGAVGGAVTWVATNFIGKPLRDLYGAAATVLSLGIAPPSVAADWCGRAGG